MDRGAWWVIVRGVAIESDMSERLNNHNHLYWKSEDPWLRGFRTMCGGGLLFSIRKSRITSLIRWHLGQVWRQEGESYVVVVQSVSPVRLFATPWTATRQAFLSFTVSQSLLKLMSIESMMPSNHLILCRPLFLLESFPASGSFQMSQFIESGGQSIGASASASVLPMNIQGWFPLGFTGLISLLSKGLSRVFSNTTVQKHQFFSTQLSL